MFAKDTHTKGQNKKWVAIAMGVWGQKNKIKNVNTSVPAFCKGKHEWPSILLAPVECVCARGRKVNSFPCSCSTRADTLEHKGSSWNLDQTRTRLTLIIIIIYKWSVVIFFFFFTRCYKHNLHEGALWTNLLWRQKIRHSEFISFFILKQDSATCDTSNRSSKNLAKKLQKSFRTKHCFNKRSKIVDKS